MNAFTGIDGNCEGTHHSSFIIHPQKRSPQIDWGLNKFEVQDLVLNRLGLKLGFQDRTFRISFQGFGSLFFTGFWTGFSGYIGFCNGLGFSGLGSSHGHWIANLLYFCSFNSRTKM